MIVFRVIQTGFCISFMNYELLEDGKITRVIIVKDIFYGSILEGPVWHGA